MQTSTSISRIQTQTTSGKGFALDTTFVLFFLAIEFGRTFSTLTLDSVFLFITLLMVLVMPYFLAINEKLNFSGWLFCRSLIASFAMLLGMMFKQSLGVILPETFKFIPLTLLIISAMLSCFIQYYSFLKLHTVFINFCGREKDKGE